MSDFLPLYQKVDPTTWAYLSSLLMIGIFFKFSRFWSVRNLDVVLLILLAPGLILAQKGIAELIRTKQLAEHSATAPAVSSGQASTANSASEPPAEPIPRPMPPERANGYRLVRMGFLWLLGTSLVWLIPLLLDPTMVRRPILEPNLSA